LWFQIQAHTHLVIHEHKCYLRTLAALVVDVFIAKSVVSSFFQSWRLWVLPCWVCIIRMPCSTRWEVTFCSWNVCDCDLNFINVSFDGVTLFCRVTFKAWYPCWELYAASVDSDSRILYWSILQLEKCLKLSMPSISSAKVNILNHHFPTISVITESNLPFPLITIWWILSSMLSKVFRELLMCIRDGEWLEWMKICGNCKLWPGRYPKLWSFDILWRENLTFHKYK